MKKYIKYILIFFLVAASITALYFYKEFNRKVADLSDKKPEKQVDYLQLIQEYEDNETEANKKYLGKLLLVRGPIAEINNQQDTLINVALGQDNDLHKVSCLLDTKHMTDIKKYAIGKKISIKGICTGFLIDVELNRCIIVQ